MNDHKKIVNEFNVPSVSDYIIDEDHTRNYNHHKQSQYEHKQFPNEFDMQPNKLANDMLAWHRLLKSFMSSCFDTKENSLEEYSRIFHFLNFKWTRKDSLSDFIEEINDYMNGDHKGEDTVEIKYNDFS